MENHLGELWAQFDFLLPGFLGGEGQFRRLFRAPIEKAQRRLAPRDSGPAHRPVSCCAGARKTWRQRVAAEDVEIRRNVELAGAQRDLYETIRHRHACQSAGREVNRKGISRAHIIILDALLKLRQVCCDPRLVKLDAARAVVKDSAKLELLMDLVPEMLVRRGARFCCSRNSPPCSN
jgi:SNF2 family DNA or RNA helicase